jgi:hypothetical protein
MYAPGQHVQHFTMLGGSRSGKTYLNSLYGKQREMQQQVRGFDINGADIWDMRFLDGRWYGTSLRMGSFTIFPNRQAGIEFFLGEYQYPNTDKITALDATGKFADVFPARFESATLSAWVESQLTTPSWSRN